MSSIELVPVSPPAEDETCLRTNRHWATTIKTIGLPFFKELCVSVPSLQEQRIADCLNTLDGLITAATQELKSIKTHKKGLMQQLFPSTEAIEA